MWMHFICVISDVHSPKPQLFFYPHAQCLKYEISKSGLCLERAEEGTKNGRNHLFLCTLRWLY